MIVKLLTEHHLELLSTKGGCRGSSESTHIQNATLLEISCTGSYIRTIRSFGQSHEMDYFLTLPRKILSVKLVEKHVQYFATFFV